MDAMRPESGIASRNTFSRPTRTSRLASDRYSGAGTNVKTDTATIASTKNTAIFRFWRYSALTVSSSVFCWSSCSDASIGGMS
jgi:hypothetical protein